MADDAATQPREPLAAEAPAEVEAAAAATATTEAEAGRAGEPIAVDDAVEQEQGQEHKSEEPQDVHPPVILLDEEDKEKAGVDPQHENAGTNDEIKEAEHDDNDDDVVMIEPPPPSTAVKAGGSPAKARSDALETEFQCVLCHDVLFKPTSVFCGHSFCRVCLMKTFLSRPIEEAQCPTCRADILRQLSPSSSPSAVFSINVTLWNAIQLLLPVLVRARRRLRQQEAEVTTEEVDREEEEYAVLLDQVDAKWHIHFLQHQAIAFHDRQARESDEDADNEDDEGEEDEEGDGETRRQRRLYPEIKVENAVDGRLALSRNVVLDTTDANEDGYASMRVTLALVEFPSIVELYSEHQECEVAVIKLEEDEEHVDGGAPFFLDEHGNDDDAFILPNYYNEITLRVRDEAGNCVLERTRGAQRGTVRFPSLRLDVPGGEYTFTFTDDLYGVKLSVTTTLREPHEASDAPLPDYIRLVADEARDGSRRGRGRQPHHSDEEEEEEDGELSDDSFIVDDEDEEQAVAAVAAFSDDDDDDGGEGVWQYSSDDEARDEERERRRVEKRRRQRQRRNERRRQAREQQQQEQQASGGPDRVVELLDDSENAHDGEDSDADGEHHQVPRGRRRNANQIVDSDDEHHAEDEEEKREDEEEDADHEGGEEEAEDHADGQQSEVVHEDVHREDEEDEEECERPAKRARRGRPIFDENDQDEHIADEEEEQFERAHPFYDEEMDEQRNLHDAIQDEEEELEDERAFGVDELGGEEDADELDRDPDDYPDDGMDGGFGDDFGDEAEFYEE